MRRASASRDKIQRAAAAKIDAYLASLAADARVGLLKLRKAIAAAAPGAQEAISYGIPAFRFQGRVLVWYAAFSHHSSFFPGAAAIAAHAADLKAYKTSKGTIQFPPHRPPPARLVAKLVRSRLVELRLSDRRSTRPFTPPAASARTTAAAGRTPTPSTGSTG